MFREPAADTSGPIGMDLSDFDSYDLPENPADLAEPDDLDLPDPFGAPDDVQFGAAEKSADELIIAADGTGYPTPSDFVHGTDPYEPI